MVVFCYDSHRINLHSSYALCFKRPITTLCRSTAPNQYPRLVIRAGCRGLLVSSMAYQLSVASGAFKSASTCNMSIYERQCQLFLCFSVCFFVAFFLFLFLPLFFFL